MSYARMDHAGWVEMNNAASNSMRRRRKNFSPAPEKLSAFQARVMDILGMVFGGIYNAPIAWGSVEWNYGNGMSLVLSRPGNGLATFDFAHLTSFVFLCHEARIRGEIEPGGFRSFRLSFWQRGHVGDMARRHPNLAEAVAKFREYLPAEHRIIYYAQGIVSPKDRDAEGGSTAKRQEPDGEADAPRPKVDTPHQSMGTEGGRG